MAEKIRRTCRRRRCPGRGRSSRWPSGCWRISSPRRTGADRRVTRENAAIEHMCYDIFIALGIVYERERIILAGSDRIRAQRVKSFVEKFTLLLRRHQNREWAKHIHRREGILRLGPRLWPCASLLQTGGPDISFHSISFTS